MADKISDIIGTLYDNFVTRDLAYATGGAMMLMGIYRCSDRDPIELADWVTSDFLRFLLFCSASYVFGLIAKVGLHHVTRWLRRMHQDSEGNPGSSLELDSRILQHYGVEVLRGIERIRYEKHLGISMAVSTFVTAILFLTRGDFQVAIVLGALFGLSFIVMLTKREQLNKARKHFQTKLCEKSSGSAS